MQHCGECLKGQNETSFCFDSLVLGLEEGWRVGWLTTDGGIWTEALVCGWDSGGSCGRNEPAW